MSLDDAREIFANDWTKLSPRAALRCMPGFLIPLAYGLATGHMQVGVIAAAGAFSVGFGSFQRLRESRITPMLWASVGMCVASWIGTVAGFTTATSILAIASGGAAFAFVSLTSSAISWIALQCAVWLVISTAYPASGMHALSRGGFLLAGGLLQTLCIAALWRIEKTLTPAYGFQPSRAHFDERFWWGSPRVLFAIESAIALILAASIYRFVHLSNSYWIPMTAVIILKPERRQAYQRGLQRILGTVVGVLVASTITHFLPHMTHLLAVLVILFAFAAYNVIYVNYGAFATCLTGYVVFILALAGLPTRQLIWHRTICTVIGGALVMLVYGVGALVQRMMRGEGAEAEETPLRKAG